MATADYNISGSGKKDVKVGTELAKKGKNDLVSWASYTLRGVG
jgi:hypothetical protein